MKLSKQQGQIQLDMSNATTLKCDNCDGHVFTTSFILKSISKLVSPTGEDIIAPVQVYTCNACGEIPKIFLEGSGLDVEEKE